LTGEIGSSSNPISGMTVATLLLTCLIFLALDRTGQTYYVTALSIGAIVCIASSNGGTTSQDLKTGFLVGGTPKLQQIAILVGALASAVVLGPILLKLNEVATVYVPRVTYEAVADAPTLPADRSVALPAYADTIAPPVAGAYRTLAVAATDTTAGVDPGTYLVDGAGKIAYKRLENFPVGLVAPAAEIAKDEEKLKGVQAKTDSAAYHVWFRQDPEGGAATHFLVDAAGAPVYMVDAGINGTHRIRPDGSKVTKFDAPKATLMSYIIKGILNRQLPWGLVLLGVMIAVVLEMSSVPSLAFAVGVYLPLSSSSPIFIGGLVRWLGDLYVRKKYRGRNLTEEQLVAEGDKSPGVLMASGYIAGGAIAGILIAFMAGVTADFSDRITRWSTANNPMFEGGHSDLLSMIPFAVLTLLLYLVSREVILAPRRSN
jgi:OPT oligopeptide transporter protein